MLQNRSIKHFVRLRVALSSSTQSERNLNVNAKQVRYELLAFLQNSSSETLNYPFELFSAVIASSGLSEKH